MMKMNIKQILSRICFVLYCFFQGYCPTQGQIKNSHVKRLASRLKAGSYEETLTNIVEWQHRNIEFWTERHPMLTLLWYICLIFAVTVVVFSLWFLVSILLLIVLNSQIVLVWFFQITPWFIQNIWWLIAVFASSIVTIFATMIFILHSNRKFPWKKIPRGLKNIVWPSIPIEFLLENKLGVCRDYAKLTACLLSNIYPNEQIYFATAPSHVATGIMIKGNLYMLDQRLPILTMDKWRNYRNARAKDKVEKFTKKSLRKRVLKKIDTFCLPSTARTTSFDTKELAKRMTKLLDIREQTSVDSSLLKMKILLKRGATLYEDNEMVNHSLARFLRMQISKALISPSQITEIEISRQNYDLKFLILFSQNK